MLGHAFLSKTVYIMLTKQSVIKTFDALLHGIIVFEHLYFLKRDNNIDVQILLVLRSL